MNQNDLKKIYTKKGLPHSELTDELWQEYYTLLKGTIAENNKNYYTVRANRLNEDKYIDNALDIPDMPETQDYRYKTFINDILHTVRNGEIDYCYYVPQIKDILQFEPSLKTKYCKEYSCFEVWL